MAGRRLILMRHARQSGLAATDHERPLTDEGHDQAHRVGTRFRENDLVPDRVLASTALRVRETWADVEAAIGRNIPVDFDATMYNATAEGLADALAGADDTAETLLLIAHNPGISVFAIALAGERDAERDVLLRGFSPATTAVFEIEGRWSEVSAQTARLLAFTAPDD